MVQREGRFLQLISIGYMYEHFLMTNIFFPLRHGRSAMKAEPLVAYAGVGVALAGTVVCYCIATLALCL